MAQKYSVFTSLEKSGRWIITGLIWFFGLGAACILGFSMIFAAGPMSLILVPAAYIFASFFGLSALGKKKRQRQESALNTEVADRVGMVQSGTHSPEELAALLQLQSGALSVPELAEQLHQPNDKVLRIVRSLLERDQIKQEIRDGIAYFTRAR